MGDRIYAEYNVINVQADPRSNSPRRVKVGSYQYSKVNKRLQKVVRRKVCPLFTLHRQPLKDPSSKICLIPVCVWEKGRRGGKPLSLSSSSFSQETIKLGINLSFRSRPVKERAEFGWR